ncbi:MAG: metal-dependent hydrolase [Peptococcia bacterium]|jgi:inner membrane protein
MDPVTHGLVGMALGIKGGGSLSLTNGLMVASVVGSLLPDLDIVFQLWGDYTYLKQHRGISHSLPSAVVMSSIGALFLSLFYTGYNFFVLLPWVLLGFLSHLFLDLSNSYGVKIFWPLRAKKYTFNLLPLFDPVLVLFSLFSLWCNSQGVNDYLLLLMCVLYFLLRWSLCLWAKHIIKNRFFKGKTPLKVSVLPSSINLLSWDFIIEYPKKNLVGSLNLGKGSYKIFQRLYRESEEVINILSETVLGQVFREFTPFFHMNFEKRGDKLICHFMDLRYRVQDRFLHNGTLVLNQKGEVEEAIFQPYSLSHCIYL